MVEDYEKRRAKPSTKRLVQAALGAAAACNQSNADKQIKQLCPSQIAIRKRWKWKLQSQAIRSLPAQGAEGK